MTQLSQHTASDVDLLLVICKAQGMAVQRGAWPGLPKRTCLHHTRFTLMLCSNVSYGSAHIHWDVRWCVVVSEYF